MHNPFEIFDIADAFHREQPIDRVISDSYGYEPRELTHLEELQNLYSDIHKDTYGFRPRGATNEQWNSESWLENAIDDCDASLQAAVERELEWQTQQTIDQEIVEQLLAQAACPVEPLKVRMFDIANS